MSLYDITLAYVNTRSISAGLVWICDVMIPLSEVF